MTQTVLPSTALPEQAMMMAATPDTKTGSPLPVALAGEGEGAALPFIDVMASLQQQSTQNSDATALPKQISISEESGVAAPSQIEPLLYLRQLFAQLPLAPARKEWHATDNPKIATALPGQMVEQPAVAAPQPEQQKAITLESVEPAPTAQQTEGAVQLLIEVEPRAVDAAHAEQPESTVPSEPARNSMAKPKADEKEQPESATERGTISTQLLVEAQPAVLRTEPVLAVSPAIPQQNTAPVTIPSAPEQATEPVQPAATSATPAQGNGTQPFAASHVVKMAELTIAPAHEAFQLLVRRAGREGENKSRMIQASTIASLTGKTNVQLWDGNTRATTEVSLPQAGVAQQESITTAESLPKQQAGAQPASKDVETLPQAKPLEEKSEARVAQGQSASRVETEAPRAAKPTPKQAENADAVLAQLSKPMEAVVSIAASEDKLAVVESQADAPIHETRSVQVPDDVVNNTAPVREVAVRLDAQGESVQVRLAERDGTLQVTVRSPQAEVAEVLRRDLDVLVDALQRTGYNAESAPASVEGASETPGLPELKTAETMAEEQQDRQARPDWDWEWLMRNKRRGK